MPSNTFANSGPSLIGHTLDNGRLEFLSAIGLGAYGVVYLAVDLHAPTPVYVAVKCLLRAGLDSRQRHFQRREIALHQLASRHPNVVTLHKVIEEGDYVFVIMDFCDEGDLFGMITERQRYIGDDLLIKKVFLQVVDAVEYCHSMGIFHRDLKPENILCTRDGKRICIADFGLATSERTSTDFGCGSTFYLSPECQGGLFDRLERYCTASNDLWSLGVILVNLTCGRNPWRQACPSDETFRAYVHNPDFLRTILPISHATNKILKGLFSLEARDRTSLRNLRRQVLAVETFTMTEDELRMAHSAARAAAAAVRPIPPAVPTKLAVPPPQVDIEVREVHFNHDYEVEVNAAEEIAWSPPCASAYAVDESVLHQVEFKQAPPHPLPQPIAATKLPPTPARTARIPVEHFDSEPYTLVPTSSRSSSSGDGDVSLPATPEFNAADKVRTPSDLTSPRWSMGSGSKKTHVSKHECLHVNYPKTLSPLSGEFTLV